LKKAQKTLVFWFPDEIRLDLIEKGAIFIPL